MCGIAGSNDKNFVLSEGELRHRGPDAFGIFKNEKINLYHWRLSIIDISDKGNQPIFNENKSIAVVFNGEIYNYRELKDRYLSGHVFYTQTDTEVIVHLYEKFGEDFVRHLNGDFSIALWDSGKETLFLYRDRLGIRPLYYSFFNGHFYFASEIKSLLKSPGFKKDLDLPAIDSYLSLRYIFDAEKTFFKNIKKLPPAHFLKFSKNRAEIKRYWNIDFEDGKARAENQIVDEFRELFSESVRLRMIADVPVGAYLSGGIDSNSIVYEMSEYSPASVKTFSIGFDSNRDETKEAEKYSRLYGTEHESFYFKKDDYHLYEKIVYFLDELVGDPIVLPTYLLSQKAGEKVKVILTGEGADEILGGYVHQFAVFNYFKYWERLPRFLKMSILYAVKSLPTAVFDRFFPYPEQASAEEKRRITDFLSNFQKGPADLLDLVSVFTAKEKKQLLKADFFCDSGLEYRAENFEKLIEKDLHHWMPNYTLLKQDRMTMANSIEGRSPFLDHRLVEFCAKIPNTLRIKNFRSKELLRRAMRGRLPEEIVNKKKKAFYLPVKECFDDNFWRYLREILSKTEIEKRGVFNWPYVDALLAAEKNLLNTKKIFNIFLLQLWFNEYV